MRAATAPQSFQIADKASSAEQSFSLRAVRGLIWTYLVLLLIEGALRKWVVPQLSDPLLIIRDPVVLGIYFFALRARVFPANAWIVVIGVIGVLSIIVTILVLYSYIPMKTILLVAAYGFRSDFLHLPLIFVMADALDLEDVKKVGRWTLLLAIPMAALMILQFRASPESFLNKAVGLGE